MKKWVIGAIVLLLLPGLLLGGYVLLITMTITSAAAGGGGQPGSAGQAVYPLDLPLNMTDDFGLRDCPVYTSSGTCATNSFHAGIDLQNRYPNSCGQPVYAVLPGEVTLSNTLYLSITHADGFIVSYLHMNKSERTVDVGDRVVAGQPIGAVGNVPPSSGCHLDLRINVSGNRNPAVAQLPIPSNAPGPWVNPEDFMTLFGVEICPPDSCRRLY